MGYILREPENFINVKLTDSGRQLLSLGNLRFKKVILSDREIDYKIGRTSYDLCNNAVLNVRDNHPIFPDLNFDGTSPTDLGSQTVGSVRQIVSAMTESIGFFETPTASTENYKIITANCISIGEIKPSSTDKIEVTNLSAAIEVGNLVYIPWEPENYYSTIHNSTNEILKDKPQVSMWYRVQEINSTIVTLDRKIPNLYTTPVSSGVTGYFYPYNGIKNVYGISSNVNTSVWNMNIVRTSSVIGTIPTMPGYKHYGSIEYAGTKHYLGFTDDTKAFGIIHYTNAFSGNTYAEQFIEKTVELQIPNVMWHKNSTATMVGTEMKQGLTLYDKQGNTFYDAVAKTSFRELRDTDDVNGTVVGRVYHSLQIFIITDQELLTALSYKTNRNFTLPAPIVSLQNNSPQGAVQDGLCQSGKTYFVSYVSTSNSASTNSYGYSDTIHCTYFATPDIVLDNEPAKFLKVEFPPNAFPFMRNQTNLTALSGTGWNSNKIQILVKEIDSNTISTFGDVPTDNWILVEGNGIYTGNTVGETIDPVYLQSTSFIIGREDYDLGSTYSISGLNTNSDISLSGMTFGSEDVFFGNVKTGILSTVFKTTITVYAENSQFNSSDNNTFDSAFNDYTYITEIGILDENGVLVAIGKPSYPIKKDISKYLAFQLEIDF